MLFERIQLSEVQLPGAIEKIKIDCLFKSIHITEKSWIIEYQLYVAGTQMDVKSGSVVLEANSPGLQGLLQLEGAIKQAATSMMPMMLSRLS
jgi:phage baseplate assembly protein gpV